MKIQVPKTAAYYYECTDRCNRLVYWIPAIELEQMVSAEQVQREILRDYPDGVDIDVMPHDFAYFRKKYGLALELDSADLINAFLSVWLKTNRSVRGSGYIEKKYLEGVARRLQKELVKLTAPMAEEVTKPRGLMQRRRALTSQRKLDREATKMLEQLHMPRVKKKASLAEQSFAKVEMTDGDDACTVFNALQQRKRSE